MVNQNTIGFSNRLRHLFFVRFDVDLNQYGALAHAAKIIMESGLYGNTDQSQETQKAIAQLLKTHLQLASAETIKGRFLDLYCKLFHCSADYLLGYIDLPTHQDTDLAAHTGLTEKAINKIQQLKRHDKNEPPSCRSLPALSRILEHPNAIILLSDFQRLFNSTDYSIPVYYDADFTPQKLPDNNVNIRKSAHKSLPDRYIVHFANEKSDTLGDNIDLPIDSATLKAISLLRIMEDLKTI